MSGWAPGSAPGHRVPPALPPTRAGYGCACLLVIVSAAVVLWLGIVLGLWLASPGR